MLYVIRVAEGLTGNYHSGGGAIVEADNEGAAIEKLKAYAQQTDEAIDKRYSSDKGSGVFEEVKIEVFDPTKIYIFEDAGCC